MTNKEEEGIGTCPRTLSCKDATFPERCSPGASPSPAELSSPSPRPSGHLHRCQDIALSHNSQFKE